MFLNKMKDNNYQLLDNCIGSRGSHYDISLYIYETSKDNPNYPPYPTNDEEYNKLKTFIKSSIVNDFILRSLHYSNIDEEENSIKSLRLLEIADKLKNEKFVKNIIKELKQFYS